MKRSGNLLATTLLAGFFVAMTLVASQLDSEYNSMNVMSCTTDGVMIRTPDLLPRKGRYHWPL